MSTNPTSAKPKANQRSATGPTYSLATAEQLQKLLLELFESQDYQPPVFPDVAFEVSALTKKPNASYEEVIGVLQKDPLIVANVLKIAQSALYGGRLQSLQNAVQRLGIKTLRDIVWQVAAGMRLFQVQGYAPLMERVRAHSIFTAHAARMIALRAGLAAEHAFLCGLLHDMGISGTLIALAEAGTPAPPLPMLVLAIDGIHEQAGEHMAKVWQLAPEIVSAIQTHHRYDPDQADVPVLSAVLSVADTLAEQNGYGVSPPGSPAQRVERLDAQGELPLEHALKRLRLQGKEEDLARRGQELAEQLRVILKA